VLPEIKEYERTSTTVINTYVLPIVRRYLATLRGGLDGIAVRGPLLIMQSNGGLMTDTAAAARPMHIIESGPRPASSAPRRWPGRSGSAS
jgi:N-methylhydantoinase A